MGPRDCLWGNASPWQRGPRSGGREGHVRRRPSKGILKDSDTKVSGQASCASQDHGPRDCLWGGRILPGKGGHDLAAMKAAAPERASSGTTTPRSVVRHLAPANRGPRDCLWGGRILPGIGVHDLAAMRKGT
ncbi:hypothetical protein PG988_010802 [Apiospora saccharicola]